EPHATKVAVLLLPLRPIQGCDEECPIRFKVVSFPKQNRVAGTVGNCDEFYLVVGTTAERPIVLGGGAGAGVDSVASQPEKAPLGVGGTGGRLDETARRVARAEHCLGRPRPGSVQTADSEDRRGFLSRLSLLDGGETLGQVVFL